MHPAVPAGRGGADAGACITLAYEGLHRGLVAGRGEMPVVERR